MTLNQRFLLPAGFLPRLAPYLVFKYYEELRRRVGAGGFEYVYMVDQPAERVINSPIGGKVIGVHGPWTSLDDFSGPEEVLMDKFIYMPKVSRDLTESARKTLEFARAVGAKYCVFHSLDYIPQLPALVKKYRMKIYMEPDLKLPKRPYWQYNHLALWEKFEIPLVFDTATPEWNGENLFDEWEKVKTHVGHIHLNEYQPHIHHDTGVMKTPKMADFLKKIKESGYGGYFDFEIGPLQSQADKIMAAVYLAACFTGLPNVFPGIQKWYAGRAQKNLLESVQFAKKYL